CFDISDRLKHFTGLNGYGLSSGKFPNKKSEIEDFIKNCNVENTDNLLCDINSDCFQCKTSFGDVSNNSLLPKTTGNSPEEDIKITPSEIAAITNFVGNDCSLRDYTIQYSLAFMKKDGGSGFLRQFRICLLNDKLSKNNMFRHVILDIKPQCNSGVDYLAHTHDVKQIVARVNASLRKERGGELCRFNRAVEIPNLGCGAFSLRARWSGQQSIDIEADTTSGNTVYTLSDPNLLCAEATILGILHRTAMLGHHDVDEYMVAIDSIRADLLTLSQTLYTQMVSAYQCCCVPGTGGCACCDTALKQEIQRIKSTINQNPPATPNATTNCCNN
ncbi:MAG: hypothetical protein HQL97_10870, partial [Magnetococcales bacterium]|nr:hypothetical protein [Magnetococcales bacterium]